jgi:hypothetical protein
MHVEEGFQQVSSTQLCHGELTPWVVFNDYSQHAALQNAFFPLRKYPV